MLTKRTECILQNVTKRTVADIGTDHAYIPIELIERRMCDKVIASDICDGPVKIARGHIEKAGLSDKIEVRKNDGLKGIEIGECEQAVIAGMGGAVIIEILNKNRDENLDFILQPMNCQYELRKYLINNGYIIYKEDIAVEGFKVYNIICCKKGITDATKMREIDFHLPPCLYNHIYFKNLKEKKHREFTKILNGNKKSIIPDPEIISKYENLLKELEALDEGI